MELTLDRRYKKDTYSIGIMYVNGERFSNTMEDRDRGLRQDMPIEEIKAKKVYGETAIPTGRYKIEMTYSSKFATKAWAKPTNGKVPEITHVPGYAGVRIHPLNCAKDSLGCVGVGVNDKKGWISQSTMYYRELVDKYIVPAIAKGESVYLNIK